MNFLSRLCFLSILSCPFFSSAQEDYSNNDWRALNYFTNDSIEYSIEECRVLLEKQDNGVAKDRTSFILARGLMSTEKYDEAIKILSKLKFEAAFLKSGISGLIGDCKSEQKKYAEALDFYKKAIHSELNESVTPYFLFKAYLCAKKLNRSVEANKYIQTIEDYFPAYSEQNQLVKYLTTDSVPAIKLNQLEITQPTIFGIGTLKGKRLSNESFVNALDIAQTNANQSAQQQGQASQKIDEDRVWKSFVEEEVLDYEYKRLNLFSNDKEMMAYLMATDGFSPQIEFTNSPAFTDDSGNFDPNKLLLGINEMKNSQDELQQEAWGNTADYYQRKLRQEKYINLIGLIPFATILELESKLAENKKYKVNFYCERFRDIPDNDISFSNEELRSYYELNKAKVKYQIKKDEHQVIYIKEEIAPTKADTASAYSQAKRLKKEFIRAQDDSSFVIAWSDLKFYTSGPFSTAVPQNHRKAEGGRYITYPNSVAKEMESTKIGGIVGPYIFGDKLTIAKIIGRTDEVINARHILLSPHPDSADYSLEEIEEIFHSVTNENFTNLVTKYSGDLGSIEKGGSLGDFFFGDMVPTFATYCADAPIGEIGLVQTQFGYHIVQVTKREGTRFPRLACVTMQINTSNESYSIAQNRLESIRAGFLSELNKNPNLDVRETMNKIAENKKALLEVFIVNDNSPTVANFHTESAEDKFIEFAYNPNNPIGAISSIFKDSLSRFVCILAAIDKKGIPTFERIKLELEADFILENKSNILRERINSHSNKEKEKRKKEVEITLADVQLPHGSFEPNVIGKAIDAFHSGKKEIVAEGISGIYYFEIINEISQDQRMNKEELRNAIYLTVRQFLVGSAWRSLLKMSSPVDNRALNRLGIRL